MSRVWIVVALFVLTSAANGQERKGPLLEARKGFETRLQMEERDADPLAPPPPDLFSLVSFPTPLGDMAAYLSKPSEPGKKHPAIIWIAGGFPPGGMDDSAWMEVSAANDQSAKAYRLAGIVTLYPTFRGSFGNPGVQEGFYGEVDDVLAAADYLSKVDYVDPERIYLGGHSTGGTLALLAAAATDRFRAVISFGPVSDPATYGEDSLPYDPEDEREARLRAPVHFLGGIRSTTYVIEGDVSPANDDSLAALQRATSNPKLQWSTVAGSTHFTVLAPANELIAKKIAGLSARGALRLNPDEVQARCDALLEPRLERLLAEDPDDPDALFERARLMYRLDRVIKALRDYDRLVGLEPDHAAGIYNRAMCHSYLGNTELAVRDYDRYVAIEPNDADGYYGRGCELLDLGRRSQASVDFQRAAELAPDNEEYADVARQYPDLTYPALGLLGCVGLFGMLGVLVLVLYVRGERRRAAETEYWRGGERSQIEPLEDEDGLVDLSGYD